MDAVKKLEAAREISFEPKAKDRFDFDKLLSEILEPGKEKTELGSKSFSELLSLQIELNQNHFKASLLAKVGDGAVGAVNKLERFGS